MNKSRRRQIDKALALVTEAANILEQVRSEEEEALENLPESLREGERAVHAEEGIGHLEDAIADLVNVEEWLEQARE